MKFPTEDYETPMITVCNTNRVHIRNAFMVKIPGPPTRYIDENRNVFENLIICDSKNFNKWQKLLLKLLIGSIKC